MIISISSCAITAEWTSGDSDEYEGEGDGVPEPDETDTTLGDAGTATEDGPGSRKLNVGDGEPSPLISLDEDDNVIVEGVPGRDTTFEWHASVEFISDADVLEYDISIPDEVSDSFDINSFVVSDVFDNEGIVRDRGSRFTYECSAQDAEDAVFVPFETEQESALMSLGSGEDSTDSSSE